MSSIYYLQGNEVASVEPRRDVSYYSDHQSNSGTSIQSSKNSPDSLAPQPDQQPHSPNPPDPRYHPDSRYQPDPQYSSPADPRFPSYRDQLDNLDGRYSVYNGQQSPVYPDVPYAVTPQRRPPPPNPHIPVHHHTSGPAVRESIVYIHTCISNYNYYHTVKPYKC